MRKEMLREYDIGVKAGDRKEAWLAMKSILFDKTEYAARYQTDEGLRPTNGVPRSPR